MGKRTETQVCITLSKWFKNYGVKCWINEGENKFTTKKTQKKPDLIIYSKKINQFIALEVKKGNVKREVYDAGKILEYYKDYVNNDIEYYIGNNKINISSFAVATIFSMFGRLFESEELQKKEELDEWNKLNKHKKIEPLNEYRSSREYLRNLWSQWRKFREKKDLPGLGIIVCDDLNREKPLDIPDAPILFDQQRELINNKKKWKVRQKKL